MTIEKTNYWIQKRLKSFEDNDTGVLKDINFELEEGNSIPF